MESVEMICDYKTHSIHGNALEVDTYRLAMNTVKMFQCEFLKSTRPIQRENLGIKKLRISL